MRTLKNPNLAPPKIAKFGWQLTLYILTYGLNKRRQGVSLTIYGFFNERNFLLIIQEAKDRGFSDVMLRGHGSLVMKFVKALKLERIECCYYPHSSKIKIINN